MRDLYHNIKVTQILPPDVANSTQTSSAIDMQGFNSAIVTFAIGESGDTLSGSNYWTLTLQHSDDNSDYTNVTTADMHGGIASVVIDAPSMDEAAYSFGYAGGRRYLKAVATPTGTHSNGTPIGIIATQGHAAYAPVV